MPHAPRGGWCTVGPMAYPDTLLTDDQLDPLYGGRPALEFGGLAWQWTNNVLRVLEAAHLLYNRNAFRTLAPLVQTGVAPGDVVAVVLAGSVIGGVYYARKVTTGDDAVVTTRLLGVCVVGASAGRRAVVATSGILPRVYAGFAALTAGQEMTVDYTAGRLKVADPGDPVIGYGDVQGNVLLDLG